MLLRKLANKLAALSLCTLLAAAPLSYADTNEIDPWEGFNRSVFKFNDGLDTYLLKPVTLGYKAVTPDIIETGISNFFRNLGNIPTALNQLLQGKFAQTGQTIARFGFNTTIGLAGLVDVATPMGLPQGDEDFGQTLGTWGVESGPYVVLPLFGPSSLRDTGGLVVDWQTNTDLVGHIDDDGNFYKATALRTIDTRSSLLAAEELISGDKYTFIRDAYLQRREFLITDGVVEDYDDDNF
ncbi:MAG: MlaA family lipoprotein [Pontibacterium sp.]